MSKRHVINPMDMRWYVITGLYLAGLVGVYIVFLLFRHFWGQYMLTDMNELSGLGYVSAGGLGSVWFIFVWAVAVPLVVYALGHRRYSHLSRPHQVIKGLWVSLNAGIFEEIIFRGFLFLNAMVMMVFFDAITFGLVQWINVHVLLPFSDWITFGALHEQLIETPEWYFGAAILSAAAEFRRRHEYLGLFGWINSWFVGMVMFYLVFNYGLLTAIAAHVIYDAIIFVIRGLTSKRDPVYDLVSAALRRL